MSQTQGPMVSTHTTWSLIARPRRNHKVSVHEHELPHASPQRHLVFLLGGATGSHTIVQFLEDVALEVRESTEGDVPQLRLNRHG